MSVRVVDCPMCGGTGAARIKVAHDGHWSRVRALICPSCRGTGGWIRVRGS